MLTNSCKRVSIRPMRGLAIIAVLGLMAMLGNRAFAQQNPQNPPMGNQLSTVSVDTTADHAINSFDPDNALGCWMDVLSHSAIDSLFTKAAMDRVHALGWGSVTMRNNSELVMSAWHWNENGAWSNPAKKEGYFTGSAELTDTPIRYVPSYSLPHRAWATSGDAPRIAGPQLYWKSNPYLTSHFTGESDTLHPQWVIIDMAAATPVDAIRINWVDPYAVDYVVQYWIGDSNALNWDMGPNGTWQAFPGGVVNDGKGGTVTLKLSVSPITTRWVRVLMTQSSNTPDTHGADDIRNCVGYAMQSVDVGTVNDSGEYTQVYPSLTPPATRAGRRGAGGGAGGGARGSFCVSSIDPWHSAENIADANGSYEHAGLDVFFTSGLTQNIPPLFPVTVLYGTPDDAANEVSYAAKRGYVAAGIEMGEECDGKHCMPEDYATLYCQWATAIHKLTPGAKLGGPIFEGVNKDITVWPDSQGRISWLGRFIDYLKDHNHMSDLGFVSFEHYPYDQDFGSPAENWDSLYNEPYIMKHILDVWREDGVPKNVPLIVSESGLAGGGGGTNTMGPMGTPIWECDAIGSLLAGGGAAFYRQNIGRMGGGGRRGVPATATVAAAYSPFTPDHMLNMEWLQHHAGIHVMFPSSADLTDAAARTVITTYAVHRPDGNWSIMLINHDQTNPHNVRVVFEDDNHNRETFTGSVAEVSYGVSQTMNTTVPGGPDATYTLPNGSITVLRGKAN